jgi:carbamoyl-phosphate synthase large subunit
MGIADTFGAAYAKSQTASFGELPTHGKIFVSLSERDKSSAIQPIREIHALGFQIFATEGTHRFLAQHGISSHLVRKQSEGHADGAQTSLELINSGEVSLIINTPLGRGTRQDGWLIRTAAIQKNIPCITTISGFKAAVAGIRDVRTEQFAVKPLQEWLVR